MADLRLVHPPPEPTLADVVAYLGLLAELRDVLMVYDTAGARYTALRGLLRPESDAHSPAESLLLREWAHARQDLDKVKLRLERFERQHNRFAILKTALAMVPAQEPSHG